PSLPAVRRDYLDFLVRTHRLDAAEPLAGEFSSDIELMLRYCDAALERRRARTAWMVWQALPPDAAGTLGRCFDWRLHPTAGAPVSVQRGLRVSLSGKQPESCDLSERYVALQPGARYRLR